MNSSNQSGELSASGASQWKLTLAYDGTDYSGWQVQPGQTTIQGELQAALERVTGESPLPQGSGRTDAGVHALAQVASFGLRSPIPAENLRRALNRTLPAAIRVTEAGRVPASFHARHSAVAKTYEYRVFPERRRTGPAEGDSDSAALCPPFLARYVYSYPWPLDFAALDEAAGAFVGTHDFSSFAATDPDKSARSGEAAGEMEEDPEAQPTAVRTIFGSQWEQRHTEDGLLPVYRVRGNGFLHHMVRNLVGTMLDMGRGYRQADEIPGMIAARARAAAGPTAPARGLFLHSVEYPR
ncbi:MAG TPA: tRNA pseudouridine(38-40) synthase TruA [Terracidiphilus sp.]|nr:tRNA pseudouridine(38-40) synthase TruA [Terracidiphilus sp.]